MQKNTSYFNNKPIMWLWIPLAFIVLQLVIEVILPSHILQNLLSEGGPHELMQFGVMAVALCVAILTLIRMPQDSPWLLRAWIGLALLCCLYVAGEEISWGQHVFEWSTSEYWAQMNDQAETNLHNTSSWLDQKPRLLLLVGITIGGLIVPLLRLKAPHMLPQKFAAIYPETQLWVIAALALIIKIADKIASANDYILFERVSEVEELYLFYFVLLYLLMMHNRLATSKQ